MKVASLDQPRISPQSICGTTFPYPLSQTLAAPKNFTIQTKANR
jgi:hypothetical protein